jgi:hypothetical protein
MSEQLSPDAQQLADHIIGQLRPQLDLVNVLKSKVKEIERPKSQLELQLTNQLAEADQVVNAARDRQCQVLRARNAVQATDRVRQTDVPRGIVDDKALEEALAVFDDLSATPYARNNASLVISHYADRYGKKPSPTFDTVGMGMITLGACMIAAPFVVIGSCVAVMVSAGLPVIAGVGLISGIAGVTGVGAVKAISDPNFLTKAA